MHGWNQQSGGSDIQEGKKSLDASDKMTGVQTDDRSPNRWPESKQMTLDANV